MAKPGGACQLCRKARPEDEIEAADWEEFVIPVASSALAMVAVCPGCQADWGEEEEARFAGLVGLSVEQLRGRAGVAADRVATFAQVADGGMD